MSDYIMFLLEHPKLIKAVNKYKGEECIIQITDNINTVTTYLPPDWTAEILMHATQIASESLMGKSGKKESEISLKLASVTKYLELDDSAKKTVNVLRESYIQKYMNDDTNIEEIDLT